MKQHFLSFVLLLALALLVSCGGGAEDDWVMDEPMPAGAEDAYVVELEFTADDIIPDEVTIPANTKVLFVIKNSDEVEDHNLVATDMELKEILVHPGQTVRRLWDGYGTTGTYDAGCTIHPWLDMTFTVE